MRHSRFMLLLLTVRVACMRPSQRAIEVPREICCPAGTYVVRSHILKPREGIPHPRCVPWACLCLYICRTYIIMYVYRPSLASASPAPSPATTSTIYRMDDLNFRGTKLSRIENFRVFRVFIFADARPTILY